MTKSQNPRDRMGVYTTLDDVPDERRLHRYAEDYEDRDPWETYLTTHLFVLFDSERFQEDARRAGGRWKAHMEGRGRHHALATPDDVEVWAEHLVDTLTLRTAYNCYWVRVERFYSWLQSHRMHPHSYHPVLMAAANGDAAAEIWAEKMRRGHGSDA